MSTRPWPAQKAWDWYRQQPWLLGFNYLPSTAVNTTEFWQAETFDLPAISRELGWAAEAGFNTCRVFVQHRVWESDPRGLLRRFAQFLEVAGRHGLSVLPVLFDDCAFSKKPPCPGRQEEPLPGRMMTSWTASPGHDRVIDEASWPSLERYVTDLVAKFAQDERVVAWDLYNEPGNEGLGERSLPLVEAAFSWAWEAEPCQPITVGVWNTSEAFSRLNEMKRRLWDVISFHRYGDLTETAALIDSLGADGRPLICTEWMARPLGSRIASHLPMFRERRVGCYVWGLVNGRTQTNFPWDFLRDKVGTAEWFHDLFHPDGRPYDPAEIALLQQHSPRHR